MDGENIINRTATVRYHYYEGTNRGSLNESNVSIFVGRNVNQHDRNTSLQLVHNNILPCLMSDAAASNLIHHDFDQTLRSFVVRNRVTLPLLSNYTIPSKCKNSLKVSSSYLNDIYRGFFRASIKALIYLHENNLSLSALDLDTNFIVHNNDLKLCSLKFVVSSNLAKRNDFALLANVFVQFIQLFGTFNLPKDLPADVNHLIGCMRNYDHGRRDFILLSNHLAVLSTEERIGVIKGFRENRGMVRVQDYITVLRAMQSTGNWTIWFDGSKPGVGPAQNCYDCKNKETNVSVYHISNSDIELNPYKLNMNLIRFCRDMAVHLSEHLPKHLPRSVRYTRHDIDLIIMTIFDNHLLSFQREAHVRGILSQLIPI